MVQHSSIDHTGVTGVISSYGSNANNVSSAGSAGAALGVSRADHVHVGVTSLSHTSNTWTGPITLVAEGSIGITKPNSTTIAVNAGAGAGSGSSLVTPVCGIAKITAQTNQAANPAAFADITGASVTITTQARRVRLTLTGGDVYQGSTGPGYLTFSVDGTDVESASATGICRFLFTAAFTTQIGLPLVYLTPVLSAGSHTFKARIKNATNSLSVSYDGSASPGFLIAEETLFTS